MEEGKQYSEYSVESNPRAYMTMRDYRNLAWKNKQPLGRNPNPNRSIREYRDQWTSTPSYSVIPTYAPPPHPQYASLSQPQPPQPIFPVEQAILDLTKLVGDDVEEQKKFNAQLSQKNHTVENPLEQKLDGFQSEVGQQFDSLQCSISKLAQQVDHQGEENPEEVCLSDTMVEDHCLQQLQKGPVENFESSGIGAAICLWEKKETIPLLNVEEVEEHQDHNLPLPPIGSVYILPSPAPQSQPKTPTANAQATYNPLPDALYPEPLYTLPTTQFKPATQFTPQAPTPRPPHHCMCCKTLEN